MTDTAAGTRVPTGKAQIGERCFVADSARLAVASERTLLAMTREGREPDPRGVRIGDRTLVLDEVVVQEGSTIGADCYVGRSVHIGFDCAIGDGCRMEYRAEICDRVRIGDGTVIGGFVCDGAELGADCVMLGSLVHSVREPDLPWGQLEPDPILRDRVFVGRGAVVVGGIVVGNGAYVAANATVTKTVPDDHVAIGTNEFVPIGEWHGRLRRKSWSG